MRLDSFHSSPTLIASTRGIASVPRRFSTFGPYLAAMSESGEVAFQATVSDRRFGAFVFGPLEPPRAVLAGERQLAQVVSHPISTWRGTSVLMGTGLGTVA